MNHYVNVIKNYVNFSGRARRQEYWMFFLVNVVLSIVLSIADAIINLSSESVIPILSLLYSLFILLPSLALVVRRLHDTNRSGWWLLIQLIPIVGGIVLLVFTLFDSTPETNKWGVSPKYAE